jgi:hypothetical protein
MTDTILAPRLFSVPQEQLTSDDYYTPAWLFERMGIEFDVDVCAPPGGVEWVPARRFYTMADDGLTSPWVGRVWMNPPYSKPAPWVARFIAHGNGACIVPMSMGFWFSDLWDEAEGMVMLPPRMVFVGGGAAGIPARIIVAAFGEECVAALGGLGKVRL